MGSILYVLALTSTFAIFGGAQKTDYCKLKSCQGNSHTLCKYSFLRVSKSCGRVQSSSLSSAEIDELLNAHNSLRNFVASGNEIRGNPGPQPAARNMAPLEWSTELAGIAQTWADQCNFGHDSCRNTADMQVGQNIASQGTTKANPGTLTELVNLWYNEVEQFDKNGINNYAFSPATGHYTQLVWAKTTHLGCGAIRYNNDGNFDKLYLVCNYGPSGNYIGQPIYETA